MSSDRTESRNWVVYLVFAIGIVAISTGSVLVRQAQTLVDSSVAVFYRLTLSVIALAPFAVMEVVRRKPAISRADGVWSAIAGGFLALHFFTWFRSLEYTTVASSVVLVTASPLVVAFLAPFVLGERLTRQMVVGIGIAIAGATVVALARGGDTAWGGSALLGNGLALTGAALIGGYLLIARHVQRRVPFIVFVTMTFGAASVVSLAIVFANGQRLGGYPAAAWGWLALLAFVPQLIGHSTLNWSLRHLPSATVAVGTLAEPIGAVTLAWLILGEPPTRTETAGAAILLAGIYLVIRRPSLPPTEVRKQS